MKILQGFRTIIFNITATIATWLGATHGIDIPDEHQAAIATTIIAIVNILLRLITRTPVFKRNKTKEKFARTVKLVKKLTKPLEKDGYNNQKLPELLDENDNYNKTPVKN